MDKEYAGFLKVQGASYLASLHNPSADGRAASLLERVVKDGNEASIHAWRVAARLAISSYKKRVEVSSPWGIEKTLKLFPESQDVQLYDRLMVAEMEILVDPSRHGVVLARLMDRYKSTDRPTMLALARWLNSKGYYSETISFAGEDAPHTDVDWLLIVLDAKSAQGKWNEVEPMLNSPAGSAIPDAVRYLFLARSATMTGNPAAADDAWSSVTASLHLEKPETLAYIAAYEEQIGAVDRAAQTYREMAGRDATRRTALVALIRLQPTFASVATLIPLYEDLVATSPDFYDAASDLNYLRLLQGAEISKAAGDAEKLLLIQPDALARISTAALGRLKKGDILGAQALYQGKTIDWSSAPAPWRVVRVAVLRAAGDISNAEKMAATINLSTLRPEEISLFKEGVTDPTK